MQPPTNNTKTYPPAKSNRVPLLFLIVLLAALGIAAANRRNIYDWWQLRSYQAPAAVVQLANQDTMTPYARKVFYVNQPAIDDKASFAKACAAGRQQEQTIILGCYHGNQNGIYVLGVDDPRLSGVEQVTAAHEMLHAAYDRLSAADRQKVDRQLLDYYKHDLHDQRILSTIDAYKKTEPNDLVNEMHSIFGTEIASLPPGLQQYYQRYFTNRQQIAAFAAQYQAAFTSRQATLDSLRSQIDGLKNDYANLQADLTSKKNQLDSRRSALIAERSSGNITAYNSRVASYNSLVDAYNSEVDSLQATVSRYNALVEQYNQLALEQNQLRNELDASSVQKL